MVPEIHQASLALCKRYGNPLTAALAALCMWRFEREIAQEVAQGGLSYGESQLTTSKRQQVTKRQHVTIPIEGPKHPSPPLLMLRAWLP